MKSITMLLSALAIGLLPATLSAQSANGDTAQDEPVNYYAAFADLMHGETDAKPAPVATHSTNRFPAFVHYLEEMNGKAEDFLAYYEKIAAASVPPAKAVFANWTLGQGCPHDARMVDCTAFAPLSIEDCSGR